jgi:acetoin utilization protein AcuB
MALVESSLFLKPTDTVETALSLLTGNNLKQLPVLKEGNFMGLLCEEDLIGNHDILSIHEIKLTPPAMVAHEDDHIFDLMKKSAENEFRILPVFNEKRKYIGFIQAREIFKDFIKNSPISEPGGILVIEMQKRDYFLSELARIIESENASVLGLFISSPSSDSEKIEITIKVNKQDLYFLKSTLERFGYDLKASFSDVRSSNVMKERYDSLMAYLNV